MVEPPDESCKFSQLSQVRSAYRMVGFSHGPSGTKATGAVIFALAVAAAYLTARLTDMMLVDDLPDWIPFALFIIYWIGGVFWWTKMVNRTIEQMDIVAVGEGHPWHPSEETGSPAVYLLNAKQEWFEIPAKARIYPQQDTVLPQIILRRDEGDASWLTRIDGDLDEKMKKLFRLVNIALALRDAQERAEGAEDPIEAARAREGEESILDHRTWEDTVSGSLTPEPGALLRRLRSDATDIVEQDEEG